MKKKFLKRLVFCFFIPSVAFLVEAQPWFSNLYEFYFFSKYSYSYFDSVDSSCFPLQKTSHNNLFYFDLDLTAAPRISCDVEFELADTTFQNFGFRSCAFQGRYLFYDDIIGDPITLVAGGNVRITSSTALSDVSTPYSANVDFEVSVAAGKEFDKKDYWKFRFWGLGAVGLADRGSPWIRGILSFDLNNFEFYKGSIFLEGRHGYGTETTINPYNFRGYASVREKNIDLGFRLGHKFKIWGTLNAEYKRRLYARRCPRNENFFSVSYSLPFSF